MLTALIYEPDKQYAQQMRDTVKEFFLARRCEMQLTTHSLAEPVFSKLQDNPHQYGILLLNADDPACAYKMAATVRNKNLQSNIFFYASDYKSLLSSLAYRPSGFFILPVPGERLQAALTRSIREQEMGGGYFILSGRNGYSRIPYETIEYFQSDQHSIYMFTSGKSGGYRFNARLDEISSKLPSGLFLRCHQSYCINVNHIADVDKSRKCILLFSGAYIPISKSNYADVIAACGRLMKDKNVI